jgi:hypothetical protein
VNTADEIAKELYMARTDIAEVRDTVIDNASTAVDTVRSQAAAAGESIGAAVTAALDTAVEARKKVDKTARAAGGKLQEQAYEITAAVHEKVGSSHRGRNIVVLGIVAAAGVAVAVLVIRKRSGAVTIAKVPPEPGEASAP